MNLLRIFSTGLMANLVFVGLGLLKQYFVASSLAVEDFGGYGSLVALASLVMMAVPFPSYLKILVHGFSAAPEAYGTRKRLLLSAQQEMIWLTLMCAAILLGLLAWAALSPAASTASLAVLLLLLVAQYSATVLDIQLRMQQAHKRLAIFMVLRNLPTIAALVAFQPNSPAVVALIEFVSALLITGWFLRTPELRVRMQGLLSIPKRAKLHLTREQMTLWLARLVQFGNASLLRLLVPLAFGALETGLFFFALIAQLPCSLFLSMTTQLFGHSLARIQPGERGKLWRIQAAFAAPNATYVLFAVIATPVLWEPMIQNVTSLAKYADAGPLVVAVVIYGAVLSSDCQEYLLRARGLSRVLLWFYGASGLVQACTFGLMTWLGQPLVATILVCAAAQSALLVGFSAYSFNLVVGTSSLETRS